MWTIEFIEKIDLHNRGYDMNEVMVLLCRYDGNSFQFRELSHCSQKLMNANSRSLPAG